MNNAIDTQKFNDIEYMRLKGVLKTIKRKPLFLFNVGFQLSYLALFFIIWLQPLIAKLWKPKSKIISFFWDILNYKINYTF